MTVKRSVAASGERIEYELIQTDRRDMSLRVTKDDVRVFAPKRARLRDCDAFVKSQADWVIQTRSKLEDYCRNYAEGHRLENGSCIMICGQPTILNIEKSPETSISQKDGTLYIKSPNLEREYLQALIGDYLKNTALEAVEKSMGIYAPIVGRSPRLVKLREQRTRWGSCSNLGNINLNWKLIMAPKQALDYVVVHELCHLYELNHSRAFWNRVKSVMPDYEFWKKWLKDNGQSLGI